jgi:redox-sensitive bicupin YhaK (pirin superfamily)
VRLRSGVFHRAVPDGWTLFTYGLAGAGRFGADGQVGNVGELLIWERAGDEMEVAATGGECRFVVAASIPLGEPVRRWGPFVD